MPEVPADLPSDLLLRRPDVAVAEARLAAASARVGQARAALFPSIGLTGYYGRESAELSSLWNPAALVWQAAAGLLQPIFEGGRLRAALEQQRAGADAAVALYRGTLLAAVEDTENALVAVDATERRESQLVVAEEAARNSTGLALSQYLAGLIDFQTLLDNERSLLATEDSRAGARADRAAATIRLFKALGGGWDYVENNAVTH